MPWLTQSLFLGSSDGLDVRLVVPLVIHGGGANAQRHENDDKAHIFHPQIKGSPQLVEQGLQPQCQRRDEMLRYVLSGTKARKADAQELRRLDQAQELVRISSRPACNYHRLPLNTRSSCQILFKNLKSRQIRFELF